MISVLLILLKIIGIVLLSLLGIFILALLLVLFVPVRYRFKGYYKEDFVCHGKVTWLLHLLSISIDYEKELVTSIKIFGIPATAFKKKNKQDNPAKTKQNTQTGLDTDSKDVTGKDISAKEPETVKIVEEPKVSVPYESISHKPAETTAVEAKTVENKFAETDFHNKQQTDKRVDAQPQTESTNDSGKKPFFNKIASIFQKIKQKIRDIIQKIHGFFCKLQNIFTDIKSKKEKLQHYISILKREEVKKALALCKKRILLLIKHILPKKMKVVIDFGFDDPSTTGYTLALYGMLPPSVGKKIILHPDFDKQMFVCDFNLKGAVNAFSLLHQLLCIISDNNCRALYHIVKKEILNERK